MASSSDLEVVRDYASHFLKKHIQKSLAEPSTTYEFEVRFGQVTQRGGGSVFRTDIPGANFDSALTLARSVEWERIEEQEVEQYRSKNRRVRVDKASGAVVENIVKKVLGEETIEPESLRHGLRFSLASEKFYAGPAEDYSAWDKSRKTRTRFSAGTVSVDFTRTRATYGKERQVEIEARLPGTPTDEEIETLAAGLVMMIATFDSALGG